jgi:predicted negative regulator of RcsB-dependent stress response
MKNVNSRALLLQKEELDTINENIATIQKNNSKTASSVLSMLEQVKEFLSSPNPPKAQRDTIILLLPLLYAAAKKQGL